MKRAIHNKFENEKKMKFQGHMKQACVCQATAVEMNVGMLMDSSFQVLQTSLSLYTTNAFAAHEMQSDTAFRSNKLSGKGCAEPIRTEHSANTLEVNLHLLQC